MRIDEDEVPAATSALPRSLFGYEVIGKLGEGAGSVIYAVNERRSGQVYALKHVVRKHERDMRYIKQLENEFEVTRKFRHPGLRRCFELKLGHSLFRRVNEAGLVMEMFDGVPLDKQRPAELSVIIDRFAQTARALSALHYLRFVHCDLKPNNILTDVQGRVKLIDFGQACLIGTTKERIQGTPDFIAPEQVKLKPVTVRTDVFNFGATLYWALSGQRIPTLFTVPKDRRDVVLECKFPSPKDLNDQIPGPLSKLVMDCVHVVPGYRPEDMTEVLERLLKV